MQCYTKETLLDAFSTDIWSTIASDIIAYHTASSYTPSHCTLQTYDSFFPHGFAHHKHCVILYSEDEYTLHCSHHAHSIIRPYSQDSDTIYYDDITPHYIEHIPANTYVIIPTKSIYSVVPLNEKTTILSFFIPQYLLLQGDTTVEIQCFSMLQSFMPENPHIYPVYTTWTLNDVIDSLGIETELVRIVFVDNIAMRKETTVMPNTKITLFPGIGGG